MKNITDINQLDLNKRYTYSDYLTWKFNERVELILGKIFKMSPAPQSQHQFISAALIIEIGAFLKKKDCKVFSAPFDVRLPVTNKRGGPNTVVQPDLCVICDIAKIVKKGCKGAPDLVVEIISESTVQRDLHEKYELYEKSGVKEYWIVHPNDIASEMTGGKVNHDDIRKDEFRAVKDVSFKCQRRVWKTSKLNNTVTLKTQRPTTPSL